MNFRIADTFSDSLMRLTGEEQKAVKMTAFDLQMDPSSPGLSFHKLDRAKDKNFWSVRASRDIRIIVHKTSNSLLLCYVDHHDDAYRWAERRKLETHPKTGAAQLVEIRERVEEIVVPTYIEAAAPAPPMLFESADENELLNYGVPPEWLDDVRQATEDNLLDLVSHLPGEAAEALLELATGGQPTIAQAAPVASRELAQVLPEEPREHALIMPEVSAERDPFDHPDAQRRFRVLSDVEELERALDYPWEKWTIFLHPAQRVVATKGFNGAARVAGSAGTGKTIVALHRAVNLAKHNPDARILLTTFSEPLANSLRVKLRRLISNAPRLGERVEVYSLNEIGKRLYSQQFGAVQIATRQWLVDAIRAIASTEDGLTVSARFALDEWENVADAWQLTTWEAYRDVKRLGRKTRLPESQRKILWGIFEQIRSKLADEQLVTLPTVFSRLAEATRQRKHPPYEFAVIDEAQDINVAQLRFLAALGGGRPNSLFFAGDLGQRIFQTPFSWKSLGVDVRGRSRTLRINYRTSHQIRRQADLLLGPEVSDVDGNIEKRSGTVSVFNGPSPDIAICDSSEQEVKKVGAWLRSLSEEGVAPHETAIFVRSSAELDRAQSAAASGDMPAKTIDETTETTHGFLTIATMHRAKGLEYRAVAVMACDDEVLPLQERIENVADDADLSEVYETERHLLYVACTRARDFLFVSGVDPASEFLDDMKGQP